MDEKLEDASQGLKLLCSLPGIEQSVFEILRSLSSHVEECFNREARLLNEMKELKEEIKALKESNLKSKPKSFAAATGMVRDAPPTLSSSTSAGSAQSKPGKGRTSNGTPRTVPDATVTQDVLQPVAAAPASANSNQPRKENVVHVPPIPEDNDMWTLVSRAKVRSPKKRVFFIGNVEEGRTKEELSEYIVRRCALSSHQAYVHEADILVLKSGGLGGRVMVNEMDAPYLTAPKFWPGELYCRPWKFKEKDNPQSGGGQHRGNARPRNTNAGASLASDRGMQQCDTPRAETGRARAARSSSLPPRSEDNTFPSTPSQPLVSGRLPKRLRPSPNGAEGEPEQKLSK